MRLRGAGWTWVAMGLVVGACSSDPRDDEAISSGMSSSASASSGPEATTTATTAAGSSSSGDEMKLDIGEGTQGCDFIDLLFVIDNSESMQTYQEALTTAFPGFVQALFEVVPPGVNLHVGVTTTDFDLSCEAAEATQNCQTNASFDEVESHYVPPTTLNDGGNGSQGRLFEWSGQRWFETSSDADPTELAAWFTGAATAAGEDGCSFEMPVAGAGWAFDPANAETNDGFVRDERALLVIFFLTDEPDKSLESEQVHVDQVLAAKEACGGRDCVFVSGLIPSCTIDVNQKLWQFMNGFGDDAPPWGDIIDTSNYSDLVGDALAAAVAQACANLPEG